MTNGKLPGPAESPLIRLLRVRRSTKRFGGASIRLEDLVDFLWCTAGANSADGRVHGSAHAGYPVTTTVAVGAVDDLPVGVYRYIPRGHDLRAVWAGDHRPALAALSLDAPWLAHVAAVVVLSADLERVERQFVEQGPGSGTRFAAVEVGLMAQGGALCAAERGLGTTLIGGFDRASSTDAVRTLLPGGHDIMALLPLGLSERPEPTATPR